jgi:hypothetical protein
MRPVIVVELVTNKDRSILSEPKDKITIARHMRVDSQEDGVDSLPA